VPADCKNGAVKFSGHRHVRLALVSKAILLARVGKGAFGSNPNKGIHLIRNPSTTERARAIDFLIAEKGQPIVIPVK